ncbi:MAG: hypothetical protein LBD73_00775 [Deferribacteraceae bacterium]|jgi:hypothetical protein|nr:hypothetical protein [Deferribacteraceae bacterium]
MKLYVASAAISIILVVVLVIAGGKIAVSNLPEPSTLNLTETLDDERRTLLSYVGLYYYYTDGYLNLCQEYGVDVSEYKTRFIEINSEIDKLADERLEELNINRTAVYDILEGEHPNSFRAGIKARLDEDNITGVELCTSLLKEIVEQQELFDLMKHFESVGEVQAEQ